MSPAAHETFEDWATRLVALAASASSEYVDEFDAERHQQLLNIAVQVQDGNCARWAAALEGLAKTGWSFTKSSRQRDIYSRVMDLAREMNDGNTFFGPAEIARVGDLSHGFFTRYKTPGVAAFAIVLDAQNHILLVQRKDNGSWAPPGGFCDPGYSGAEAAQLEVEQETGIAVDIDALVGVADSMPRDPSGCQYALIFKATPTGGRVKVNEAECLDVAWFALDQIPSELHHDGDPWLAIARELASGTFSQPYFDAVRPAIIDVREDVAKQLIFNVA